MDHQKLSTKPLPNLSNDIKKPYSTADIKTSTPLDSHRSSHTFGATLEKHVESLKYALEGWRELILQLNSILLWDKPFYPAAIAGGSTILFLALYILDPSILTTLSLVGLTVTLSDYLVPSLLASLFRSAAWTPAKENQFDDICRNVLIYKAKLEISCQWFYNTRKNNSKFFYGFSIVSLALLAWVGNSLNNLFLTYLLVTFVLLLPGMEYHGILRKYGDIITQKFSSCAIIAKSKMAEAKKDL